MSFIIHGAQKLGLYATCRWTFPSPIDHCKFPVPSAVCRSFIIVFTLQILVNGGYVYFSGPLLAILLGTKVGVPKATCVDVNMREDPQGFHGRVPLCDVMLLNVIQPIVLTMDLWSLLCLEAFVVSLDDLPSVLLDVICEYTSGTREECKLESLMWWSAIEFPDYSFFYI